MCARTGPRLHRNLPRLHPSHLGLSESACAFERDACAAPIGTRQTTSELSKRPDGPARRSAYCVATRCAAAQHALRLGMDRVSFLLRAVLCAKRCEPGAPGVGGFGFRDGCFGFRSSWFGRFLLSSLGSFLFAPARCSAARSVATERTALQQSAPRCSAAHCVVAMECSTLQRVAARNPLERCAAGQVVSTILGGEGYGFTLPSRTNSYKYIDQVGDGRSGLLTSGLRWLHHCAMLGSRGVPVTEPFCSLTRSSLNTRKCAAPTPTWAKYARMHTHARARVRARAVTRTHTCAGLCRRPKRSALRHRRECERARECCTLHAAYAAVTPWAV